MKNFIDHLTMLEERGFLLEGKVAGFIATCEEDGGQQALNAMTGPLSGMGLIIPPFAMLFYNINMAEKSEHGWQEKDPELVGANVARMVKQTMGMRWGYEFVVEPRG